MLGWLRRKLLPDFAAELDRARENIAVLEAALSSANIAAASAAAVLEEENAALRSAPHKITFDDVTVNRCARAQYRAWREFMRHDEESAYPELPLAETPVRFEDLTPFEKGLARATTRAVLEASVKGVARG